MIARSVRLRSFGFFDDSGFGGMTASHSPIALADLTWARVSQEPFKRFGQLDAIAKTVMTAVEMAAVREAAPADTAIVAATTDGCLGADIEFYQSMSAATGASPRIFAYTLPSIVCGEIAIRYGWTGPNLCLVTPNTIEAIVEGYFSVADGDSPACLAVGYDASFEPSARLAAERGMLLADGRPNAHVFMLQAVAPKFVPGWYLTCDVAARRDNLPELSTLRELKDFMLRSEATGTDAVISIGSRGQPLMLRYLAKA